MGMVRLPSPMVRILTQDGFFTGRGRWMEVGAVNGIDLGGEMRLIGRDARRKQDRRGSMDTLEG